MTWYRIFFIQKSYDEARIETRQCRSDRVIDGLSIWLHASHLCLLSVWFLNMVSRIDCG